MKHRSSLTEFLRASPLAGLELDVERERSRPRNAGYFEHPIRRGRWPMPTTGKSCVIPGMRYRDAPAAIDWLCRVLGFSKSLVVPGEGGIVLHAQLTLGDGMVMLGSERDDAHGVLMSVPGPGGANTQSTYVVVDDPEAVHELAVTAGAEIVSPLESPEYGGTFFACRDPEGHVWNIGSYDPWAEPAT